MTYLDARRKESVREVEPIEIRRFRSTATLVAYCCLRGDRRTFKLDRIVRLETVTAAV
jgi:predicted DNA-binding transcriptional regulator YafY